MVQAILISHWIAAGCEGSENYFCLIGFPILADTRESPWVSKILQTDEQGKTEADNSCMSYC